MVPKPATELRKPPSDVLSYAEKCEDEGDSLYAAGHPDGGFQCYPYYLVGVGQMLRWIADGVQYHISICESIDKETTVYLESHGINDYVKTPEEVLEQLIADITVVKPMIAQLKEHPGLFDDARTRNQFFDFAVSTIKEALDFTKVYDKWDKGMERFGKVWHEAAVSTPVDPALGEPRLPWQSWCRLLQLAKNS